MLCIYFISKRVYYVKYVLAGRYNWNYLFKRGQIRYDSQVEFPRSGTFARAAYWRELNRKEFQLVLYNKYDTLLGISELVYIHIFYCWIESPDRGTLL